MKPSYQISLSGGKRYTLPLLASLLMGTFFINPVAAQRRIEKAGREQAPVRGGAERAPGQEPAGRGREVSIERNNQPRDINRNPAPVRGGVGRDVSIERNNLPRDINRNPAPVRAGVGRDDDAVVRNPGNDRNPGIERNPTRPQIRGDRNPNAINRPNTYTRPGNPNRPVVGTMNRPGYRPVYGYDRHPHYNAYNPAWQYGYLPRRNSYFYSLPSNYFNISFGGIGYRYWDGVFYRPYNNLFAVIAPPVGIYINVLPVGYRRIIVRERPYYYFNGTYYDQRQNNYYVVSPPVGAVVESLPAGYETVVIDGETYYTADGAQYKPVVQQSGEIWYEVIKAN